jgi:hypothetical protein
MPRYLVVAHQTLSSPELAETLRAKAADEDCSFHLLVPMTHAGSGLTWTEGHARAEAQRHLEEARQRFDDLAVDGEVGADSPVDAVDEVLRREGPAAFDAIVVSTLPVSLSRWLKLDVPSRVQRKTRMPVEHVIGHPATIDA